MTSPRTVLAIGLAATVAVVALSGCTSRTTSEVIYSAWADGGKVESVRYSFIDGANGALSLPATPRSTSWTVTKDGGHGPALSVIPSPGAVAHCALIRPDKNVLVARSGAPGAKVSCSWQGR